MFFLREVDPQQFRFLAQDGLLRQHVKRRGFELAAGSGVEQGIGINDWAAGSVVENRTRPFIWSTPLCRSGPWSSRCPVTLQRDDVRILQQRVHVDIAEPGTRAPTSSARLQIEGERPLISKPRAISGDMGADVAGTYHADMLRPFEIEALQPALA